MVTGRTTCGTSRTQIILGLFYLLLVLAYTFRSYQKFAEKKTAIRFQILIVMFYVALFT